MLLAGFSLVWSSSFKPDINHRSKAFLGAEQMPAKSPNFTFSIALWPCRVYGWGWCADLHPSSIWPLIFPCWPAYLLSLFTLWGTSHRTDIWALQQGGTLDVPMHAGAGGPFPSPPPPHEGGCHTAVGQNWGHKGSEEHLSCDQN